ncbi:MAG: hypothetical protein RI972_1630, partial [Pseudomonadota bacterium]
LGGPWSAREGLHNPRMHCASGCAACCIAPSITQPIPGMPQGKPAGVPCVQLTADRRCALFGQPERPAFCSGLQPSAEMCGDSPEHAMQWLARLEVATRP